MALTIEDILIAASGLLLLSVIASKAFGRMGIPALLLFLGIGMLAGSDGPGGIHFDNPWLAQSLGVVALTFILFAGGMDTDWESVRRALGIGVGLSTVGVAVTAGLVGWFAVAALQMSWHEGLLIGAIVSSTDAAAVFAVMRSRYVSLRGILKPLLELESGSNDPMAVFLTIGIISLITGASGSPLDLVPMFIRQMVLGGAIGYGIGKLMVLLVNRLRLEYEGLYPVLTLSFVLLTYSGSTWLGGNGFLAVYLAGLMMGNSEFVHKRSLTRFHDGLAWLMQITMFLALGLQVFPTQLVPIAGTGLLLALFSDVHCQARGCICDLGVYAPQHEGENHGRLGWIARGRADYSGHLSAPRRGSSGHYDVSSRVFYRPDIGVVTGHVHPDRSPMAEGR